MAAPDDFSSIENLQGFEAKTATTGAKLMSALYYIALGVAAIWLARKLFK